MTTINTIDEKLKYLTDLKNKYCLDINDNVSCLFKCACANGDLDIIQYLYELYPYCFNDKLDFYIACKNGKLNILQQLYEWKPFNEIDDIFEKSYIIACINGFPDIVTQLCTWHSDIHNDIFEDGFLKTIDNGHYETMVCLYNLRPDINISLASERPFVWAFSKGYDNIVNQLLLWKPTINKRINNDEAFRWAVLNGSLLSVTSFINSYDDIDFTEDDFVTFRFACESNNKEIVNLIYSKCVFVNFKKFTLLEWIIENNFAHFLDTILTINPNILENSKKYINDFDHWFSNLSTEIQQQLLTKNNS